MGAILTFMCDLLAAASACHQHAIQWLGAVLMGPWSLLVASNHHLSSRLTQFIQTLFLQDAALADKCRAEGQKPGSRLYWVSWACCPVQPDVQQEDAAAHRMPTHCKQLCLEYIFSAPASNFCSACTACCRHLHKLHLEGAGPLSTLVI